MDYSDWIPILEKEIQIEYSKAPKELHSTQHQIDHIQRVWKRAEKIGETKGADLEILVAAVYLHDIGRQYGLEFHGPKSAECAKNVLSRIEFPKDKIDPVLLAIETHDYQTDPHKRNTLEAKILYDADKLDAFGTIGIKRFTQKYLVEKTVKMSVPEILDSIDRRWATLMLSETKKYAKDDYNLIKEHFEKML